MTELKKEWEGVPLKVARELDEAGLNCHERSVIMHVARSVNCISALPRIARIAGVSRTMAQRCLHNLSARGFITCQKRSGDTTSYHLNVIARWRQQASQAPVNNSEPSSISSYPLARNRATTQLDSELPPSSISSYEGHPLKDIPLKTSSLKTLGEDALKAGKKTEENAERQQLELWDWMRKFVPDAAKHHLPILLRQNPGKMRRVLADCEERAKRPPKVENWGGYITKMWEVFK